LLEENAGNGSPAAPPFSRPGCNRAVGRRHCWSDDVVWGSSVRE
jgi:hypothetical protein